MFFNDNEVLLFYHNLYTKKSSDTIDLHFKRWGTTSLHAILLACPVFHAMRRDGRVKMDKESLRDEYIPILRGYYQYPGSAPDIPDGTTLLELFPENTIREAMGRVMEIVEPFRKAPPIAHIGKTLCVMHNMKPLINFNNDMLLEAGNVSVIINFRFMLNTSAERKVELGQELCEKNYLRSLFALNNKAQTEVQIINVVVSPGEIHVEHNWKINAVEARKTIRPHLASQSYYINRMADIPDNPDILREIAIEGRDSCRRCFAFTGGKCQY